MKQLRRMGQLQSLRILCSFVGFGGCVLVFYQVMWLLFTTSENQHRFVIAHAQKNSSRLTATSLPMINKSDTDLLRGFVDIRLTNETKKLILNRLKKLRRSSKESGENFVSPELVLDTLVEGGYEAGRLSDVIIIGVKKGGTTALKTFLDVHPQIQVASSEPHYFDWNYSEGLDWYRNRMPFAKKTQLVLDGTPRYFVTQSAPKNIRDDIYRNIKLILCVRDPIYRLISDFRFTKTIRSTHGWRINQTAESEARRLRSDILTESGHVNSNSEIVHTSDYAHHFEHWLNFFAREQFLIVENGQMKRNLTEVLQNVEKFLGISHFFDNEVFTTDGLCLREKWTEHTLCPSFTTDEDFPFPKINEELYALLRDYYRPRKYAFERMAGRTFNWTT